MLQVLRKHMSGWVAFIFLGLLVFSFAIWGIADIFRGFGTSEIARVGSTPVSIEEFQRSYTLRLQNLSAQFQQPITPDQARLFGVPGQVLGQLVTEAALNDRASQFGLGISNEKLSLQITRDPSFTGGGSSFSRLYFEQVLRSSGLTETSYVRIRREAELRQQIAEAVAGGLSAPATYRKAIQDFQKESRTVSFLVLKPDSVAAPGDPIDSQLDDYFAANKEQWRAPEYRALTVVAIEPSDLARPEDVTDEQAREEYDTHRADYGQPERRRIEQISFAEREAADKAAEALAAGTSFEDVGKDNTLVELGLMSRAELVDPTIAQAAFGLSAGETSAVVDGRFGPTILKVTEIVPEQVKPFEEVVAEIKQDIAEQNAVNDILDEHDRIEDARAAGGTLDEIAQRFNLPIVKIEAVDKDGMAPDESVVAGIPEGSNLLAEAFATDIGIEADVVQFGDRGFAWFEVNEVTPSRERTLDEVRDSVVEAWRQDEVAKALEDKASSLADSARTGTALAELASANGLGAVETRSNLTRLTDDSAPLPTEVLQSAFGGPVGYVATAPAGENYVILRVDEVTIPDGAPDPAEDDLRDRQIAQQLGSNILEQYIGELQRSLGVTVNQAAVQTIVGGSSF